MGFSSGVARFELLKEYVSNMGGINFYNFKSGFVVSAEYIAHQYTDIFVELSAYKLNEEEIKLLKKALLEQTVIVHEQICSRTSNFCYTIKDYVTMDNDDKTSMDREDEDFYIFERMESVNFKP
ncbi:hypothetical protein NECAME_03679 [Necator americanus]|uniref:Uncharacterized protein n=1 Tax=Necator americanus TaxID=51031 RepID=W2T408_NECAM|nr:hypothetical protein NECAME_03679 [Necator americanus]ETN75707.1 hypothetical protein NECAME_03679 [Necator americanus]